jgi:hypothetical protein
MKEDEMGRVCSTHGEKEAYSILVGKTERKKPLRRHSRWWDDNNKKGLTEMGCYDMD